MAVMLQLRVYGRAPGIPASAYLGVAAGVGEIGEATGALLVLTVNVVSLIAGGTLTLLTQRALERRTS
jgi:hypothetical protein